MNAAVSERGQITIPKKVRDELGLVPGSILDFREENGQMIVRKVPQTDPLERWRGKGRLPADLTVDAYLARSRGEQ